MEVTVARQVPGSHHVAVKPPELLHRGEGADLFDVLFVALGAGGAARGPPGVPERVVVLQGVLCRSRDNSLPLAAALALLALGFFLLTIFLCAVFFILIVVPAVIVFQGVELVVHPLAAAVATASRTTEYKTTSKEHGGGNSHPGVRRAGARALRTDRFTQAMLIENNHLCVVAPTPYYTGL